MKEKKSCYATPDEKLKIVKAYRNETSVYELEKIFCHSRSSIYNWINQYRSDKTLKRKTEPGSGQPPKITDKYAKKLIKILKMPASLFGFETDLWNSVRIQTICKKQFGLKVSRMAVWRMLSKFDQSFKKVQKRYYEVDKKKQNEWLEQTLPKIKAAVKKHNAILYFEDESNIQLSPVMGKSWGPIGEKIVHTVTGNRGSISAISAISKDGRLIFNLFDGGKRFNSDDIILFLKQMLDNHTRRHLVIVMDQATCHKSKKVKAYEEDQKRLHIFYLPPRSPEYNPDEQVWSHLKNHVLKSHMKTNLQDLKKLTRKKLRNLSSNPKKVRGVFKRCENHFLYL